MLRAGQAGGPGSRIDGAQGRGSNRRRVGESHGDRLCQKNLQAWKPPRRLRRPSLRPSRSSCRERRVQRPLNWVWPPAAAAQRSCLPFRAPQEGVDHRTRRASGWDQGLLACEAAGHERPMSVRPGSSASSLENRLVGLGTMSPTQLRAEYRHLFKAEAPNVGPSLLSLAISRSNSGSIVSA